MTAIIQTFHENLMTTVPIHARRIVQIEKLNALRFAPNGLNTLQDVQSDMNITDWLMK